MLFRQLFDNVSSTYTYLLASRKGGEALLIDPVLDHCDRYLKLLEELDLKLVKAVDTHCHADHITGLGRLRDATRCITVMGEKTAVDLVSMRVAEGDSIDIENVSLKVLYTPGHTDDSYCYAMGDRVFTGDTLLIRGTGRTDFQNGSSHAAYDSLFNKVLKLPEETLVYPGHDYKGDTVSTIAEERAFNPRLQVSSADEYAAVMAALNLPNPKMMDVAVPANLTIGEDLKSDPDIIAATLVPLDAMDRLDDDETLFIDLREASERARDGVIPDSLHVPYPSLADALSKGGLLNAMLSGSGKRVLFYCAHGERSALALKAAGEAGIKRATHLGGGFKAWLDAGGACGTG
jgi:sulfur dioxygenase